MSKSLTLKQFWQAYIAAHSDPLNRRFHFIGSTLAILFLILAFAVHWWFVILVPLAGYGFAWYGHFRVQKNRPETFNHPFYSLICDYYMFFLILIGKMESEVRKYVRRE